MFYFFARQEYYLDKPNWTDIDPDGETSLPHTDENCKLTDYGMKLMLFWLYFSFGRLLYWINEKDRLGYIIWISGQSDSGKSTLVESLIHAWFDPEDRGLFGQDEMHQLYKI